MDNSQPFDAARYLTLVNGNDYLEVKWRLVWLRTMHPDAQIETEMIKDDSWEESGAKFIREAVFRATVTLPSGGKGVAYGSETSSDFRDYREKAETKAIGRACAHLGFGTQFAPDMGGEAAAGRIVDAPVRRAAQGASGGPSVNQPVQGGQVADTARYPAPVAIASQRPQNEATGAHPNSQGQMTAGAGVRHAPPGAGNVQQVQQQQGQQRPAVQVQNPDAPASPSQIKYVTDLLAGMGVNPSQFEWEGLTKGEASDYIGKLQTGVLPEGVQDALNQLNQSG